jgi:hypothetical protein
MAAWRSGSNCWNLRQGDAIFNRVLLVRLPFIICLFIALFSVAVFHTIFTIYGSRIGLGSLHSVSLLRTVEATIMAV